MAGCKLTSSINKENCSYNLAGVKAVYLFNYDFNNTYVQAAGAISEIKLVDTEKAYKIDFIDNTASFADELAQNGNGGKYRTHTLNFSLSNYSYEFLNQGHALSLGKFTAVVVDKTDRAIILGRHNGLSATAFNYESGAADADATGWTVTMVSSEKEIAQLLKDEKVIESIVAGATKIIA